MFNEIVILNNSTIWDISLFVERCSQKVANEEPSK